jgi:hypothetical protein
MNQKITNQETHKYLITNQQFWVTNQLTKLQTNKILSDQQTALRR